MTKAANNRILGGVLLIAGTTLGVGMLGFPTTTAFGGFTYSTLLFLVLWVVMLTTAFFFLDANLSIKGEANMITMAEKKLGIWGKVVCWVVYLLLLYSLVASFIAGCTPLFTEVIFDWTGYTLPKWLAPFGLPLLFGGFVYLGTRGVDLLNRILMIGLILSFGLLIFFVPAEVSMEKLSHFNFPAMWLAVPVVITAFGYHIIIPSLTIYMDRDPKKLRKTILIGSIVPIFVYLFWQVLILGTVPIPMLADAYKAGLPATTALSQVIRSPIISLAAKFFSFFAIVTSFVGVTLSLADFLADGFKIKKTWSGRALAMALTFLPPLFFVLTYEKSFYIALDYAGAFVAVLLVILPAAMVWKLPKYKKRKFLLCTVMAIGVGVVVLDFLIEGGLLTTITQHRA